MDILQCCMSWTSLFTAIVIILTAYYVYPVLYPVFPNVPGPTAWPFIGNSYAVLSKGTGYADTEFVKKYGKIVRIMEGRKAILLISDPEVLKHVLVKDFTTFSNRRPNLMMNKVLCDGLFNASDSQWRRLRHLLTPAFTSGKLKQMIPIIKTCIDRLVDNLEVAARAKEKVEIKRFTGALSMDVIACTAFGLELDSQSDTNNPFLVHSKKLFDFDIRDAWLFLIAAFVPFTAPIFDGLGFTIGPKDTYAFLESFLEKVIKERKTQNKPQNDFLQMLIDIESNELDQEDKEDLESVDDLEEKEKAKGISVSEIKAQCMLFFLAAYDTTSTTMSFLIYNLAENTDIQEKLHREIQEVMADYTEPSYEAISRMTYLDQCINETLRMFPPLIRVDRRCNHDTDICGLHIPADTIISIPVYVIHHDEQVWPQPDKFDPERFCAENKASRGSFHHLPFGLGPRQCIGMRLALMEMKLAFVKIFTKYKFTSAGVPLDLDLMFIIRSKTGIWVIPELRVAAE